MKYNMYWNIVAYNFCHKKVIIFFNIIHIKINYSKFSLKLRLVDD